MTAVRGAAHIMTMEKPPPALPKLGSVITPTTWVLAGLTVAAALLRPVFGG